jgi:hypothetical protein
MDCFVFFGANMYNKLYKNHFLLRLFAGRINLEKIFALDFYCLH